MTESRISMALFNPTQAFEKLAYAEVTAGEVLFKYALWLLLIPPTLLFISGYLFSWDIGAEEPIKLSTQALLVACIGYFLSLLFGFISTGYISRWMSQTYDATDNLGIHFALVAIVGAPLAIISVIHLLPSLVFNIIVFLPALIWSMYLLYTGVPVVLRTTPEKGMLMASAIAGWLLTAAVSLLGISLAFWSMGFGSFLGV